MMLLSEIRAEARKSLQGKWGTGALFILAYSIFSYTVCAVSNLLGTIGSLLNIVYLIFSMPLSFGLLISFIKLKRSEEVGPFDFFKNGYANFSRAWSIFGHMLLKILVYIIIAVIGAVILGFSTGTAIAGAILASSEITQATIIGVFVGSFLYIGSAIFALPKEFLYVLSFIIGFDNPEMTAKEAVEKSAELMKGNRFRYLFLGLSFIGWIFLSIFTLGIGLCWVETYMQTSFIVFYEELAGKLNSNPVNDENSANEPIQTKD